jgi:hypothetical protein
MQCQYIVFDLSHYSTLLTNSLALKTRLDTTTYWQTMAINPRSGKIPAPRGIATVAYPLFHLSPIRALNEGNYIMEL